MFANSVRGRVHNVERLHEKAKRQRQQHGSFYQGTRLCDRREGRTNSKSLVRRKEFTSETVLINRTYVSSEGPRAGSACTQRRRTRYQRIPKEVEQISFVSDEKEFDFEIEGLVETSHPNRLRRIRSPPNDLLSNTR